MSSQSEDDDAQLRQIIGKIPTRAEILKSQMKQRKFFDSGDYAMSKAGKKPDIVNPELGSEHPVPERIPHRTALLGAHGASPVRRPSTLVPPQERFTNATIDEDATID